MSAKEEWREVPKVEDRGADHEEDIDGALDDGEVHFLLGCGLRLRLGGVARLLVLFWDLSCWSADCERGEEGEWDHDEADDTHGPAEAHVVSIE